RIRRPVFSPLFPVPEHTPIKSVSSPDRHSLFGARSPLGSALIQPAPVRHRGGRKQSSSRPRYFRPLGGRIGHLFHLASEVCSMATCPHARQPNKLELTGPRPFEA